MTFRNKIFFPLVLFLYIVLPPAHAASKMPVLAWKSLTDQNLTPNGQLALSLTAKEWKHAETEHFIYHFTNEKKAETVYLHAELYYRWIKNLFGVQEDHWAKKAQIYIFTDKSLWEAFIARVRHAFKGDAFTDGRDLFMFRDAHWAVPRRTLAHEITHLIVFRFLEKPIPLFLNEGFAGFVSYRTLAWQFGRSEYSFRKILRIPRDQFIPLIDLITMESYPEDQERRKIFYRESELLVRMLILNYDGPSFYRLLQDVSGGASFVESVQKIYRMNLETIKVDFYDYAVSKR